jgi:hypothetical protein
MATLINMAMLTRPHGPKRAPPTTADPAFDERQCARVLAGIKALRYAPTPLRGADGLDAGSARAGLGICRRTPKTPALTLPTVPLRPRWSA